VTTTYSRVTVAHDTRTVDLAMPSALPLADVLPQLLRLCIPDLAGEQPQVWVLGRPGEEDLDLSRTLSDAGIYDGDVLELRRQAASPAPAYVEDVRDAVEDAVEGSSRHWDSAITLGFVIATGTIALAASTLLPDLRQPRDIVALTAAATVAAALVPAVWWTTQRTYPSWGEGERQRAGGRGSWLAHLVIGVACLWGGLSGWLAGSWLDNSRLAWLTAAAGVLLVTVAIRSITRIASGHLAAAAVLIVATAGGTLFARTDPYHAARALGVAAVITVGALPRAALTVGGLAAADYRVRNAMLLTQDVLVERIQHSSRLLTGALTALAAIAGTAGVVLAYQPGVWDRLLALAIGVGVLLRSRLVSRVAHVLPLRIAGVTVLAALALRHSTEAQILLPWIAVAALAITIVVAMISVIPLSDITHARVKQLLNWFEHVVVIALIALAAGALGVYHLVALRTG
jgi:type VII secretion integral membrane protein EccD